MILFDLRCSAGHGFEGWFKDSASFEEQVDRGELSCPVCGDRAIGKALMAPRVQTGARAEAGKAVQVMSVLRQIRAEVERRCDYVGPKFAEEARRIHDGEERERGIYGEATKQEVEALRDDGIEVAQVPWVPPHDA